MDIKRKVGQPDSQGNAAAEYSDFTARSGSWQYGRDARFNDIIAEGREENLAFGVTDTTEDSTADESQYGLRGAEQHAVSGGK